jgi:hypothetical protein
MYLQILYEIFFIVLKLMVWGRRETLTFCGEFNLVFICTIANYNANESLKCAVGPINLPFLLALPCKLTHLMTYRRIKFCPQLLVYVTLFIYVEELKLFHKLFSHTR